MEEDMAMAAVAEQQGWRGEEGGVCVLFVREEIFWRQFPESGGTGRISEFEEQHNTVTNKNLVVQTLNFRHNNKRKNVIHLKRQVIYFTSTI